MNGPRSSTLEATGPDDTASPKPAGYADAVDEDHGRHPRDGYLVPLAPRQSIYKTIWSLPGMVKSINNDHISSLPRASFSQRAQLLSRSPHRRSTPSKSRQTCRRLRRSRSSLVLPIPPDAVIALDHALAPEPVLGRGDIKPRDPVVLSPDGCRLAAT